MLTLKTRRILLLLSTIIFIIIAPLTLLYTSGYRIASDFSITKTGGIYVSSPVSGSEIFLNNKPQKTTNILQSGVFIQSLRPNIYSVLVGKDGYWPWQKNLEVRTQFVTEARAFLISQSPDSKILMRGPIVSIYASPYDDVLMLEEVRSDIKKIIFYTPKYDESLIPRSNKSSRILASYNTIDDLFWYNKLLYIKSADDIIKISFDFDEGSFEALYSKPPDELLVVGDNNKESLLVKYDKRERVRLWHNVEKNEIWAEWLKKDTILPYYFLQEKILVFKSKTEIKAFNFFPLRSDLIIFAADNGVFAMELDGRGGRMLQPIYKGKDPTFAVFPSQEYVFILDNGVLSRIEL